MDIDALSSPWDSSRSSSSCEEEPYGGLAVPTLLTGATESLCSQEEEGHKKRQSRQGNGAGVPQQDGSWRNIAFTHSQVSRASAEEEIHLQAPRKNVANRREDQKNPPFEDFKETLRNQDHKDAKSHQYSVKNQRAFVYQPSSTAHAQGDPPPLAKLAVAPTEKRQECDDSKAQSEIKSQRWLQPLAKSTQTEGTGAGSSRVRCSVEKGRKSKGAGEAGGLGEMTKAKGEQEETYHQQLKESCFVSESAANQTQLPCFPDGRGNKNSIGLEKRNSPPPLGGAGRKWAEGCAVQREEELKELGWINYGFTTEPVYTKLDCPTEEGVQMGTVTSVNYKDDHHLYCFDYGNRHYYQPKREHENAYMMKLAESSEKVIQQNLREFFGLLKILVNVVLIFLIELVRFLGKSVFQVLVVGLMTTVGDHILKPFLVAMFNGILQPLLLFLLNVLCSVRNLTYPVIDILKGVCLQLAVLLQAFRLVEVTIQSKRPLAQKV